MDGTMEASIRSRIEEGGDSRPGHLFDFGLIRPDAHWLHPKLVRRRVFDENRNGGWHALSNCEPHLSYTLAMHSYCPVLVCLLLSCGGAHQSPSTNTDTKITGDTGVPTKLDQVCGYVDATEPGLVVTRRPAASESIRLTTPQEGERGSEVETGADYWVGANSIVTMKNDDSTGQLSVTATKVSLIDFGQFVKRSGPAGHIRLAYGVSGVVAEMQSQVLLPGQPLGLGARWLSATRHEYGGVVTHFSLEGVGKDGSAEIAFTRLVCLRDLPYASPDGDMDESCHTSSVEQSLETGVLRIRPELPLPDADVSAVIRHEYLRQCDGLEPNKESIDSKSSISLRWQPAGL